MRSLMISCVVLVAGVGSAQAAPVRWQGEFMITSQTGVCDRSVPGDFGRVRFRPGIGGDNGPDSNFNVFGFRQTWGYALPGALFDKTFQTVETVYVGDTFFAIENPVKVKFATQKPATIATDTDFIDVTGQIKGYDSQPDCTVSFKMTLFQRVDGPG